MVELGRLVHAESPRFRRLQFSPEKIAEVCERLITLEGGFAWVGVRDGEVVAAMIGTCEEAWVSVDKVASEIALFVRATARGSLFACQLVSRFVVWAEDEGAKFIMAGASTGIDPERTAQFYERFGFERTGTISLERCM